jgi:hypothetical protein
MPELEYERSRFDTIHGLLRLLVAPLEHTGTEVDNLFQALGKRFQKIPELVVLLDSMTRMEIGVGVRRHGLEHVS